MGFNSGFKGLTRTKKRHVFYSPNCLPGRIGKTEMSETCNMRYVTNGYDVCLGILTRRWIVQKKWNECIQWRCRWIFLVSRKKWVLYQLSNCQIF